MSKQKNGQVIHQLWQKGQNVEAEDEAESRKGEAEGQSKKGQDLSLEVGKTREALRTPLQFGLVQIRTS